MWMDNWILNLPLQYWPCYKKNNLALIFRCFAAKTTAIILANSNIAQTEVDINACQANNIPILRRKGGGGTVLLGPGCLILSFAFYAKDIFSNEKYFKMINDLWIQALEELIPVKLTQNNSDICAGDKKIAGTSIFRKKHLLVYQGSLLVNPDLNLINNLLLHPSKEPEYRKKRSHLEFLTTLTELGCNLSTDVLAHLCNKYFMQHAPAFFADELLNIAANSRHAVAL